jgi:hypothetical protein
MIKKVSIFLLLVGFVLASLDMDDDDTFEYDGGKKDDITENENAQQDQANIQPMKLDENKIDQFTFANIDLVQT